MKKNNQRSDFTIESLPRTRREQFGQLIRDNILLFIKIGFILLLILTPFVISLLFKGLYDAGVMANTDYSETDKMKLINVSNLIFNAVLIVCLIIFFIFLGGILKIYRRLIWNEPLFFKDDFLLGVKENILHFSLIGFLIGLLNFINVLAYYFLPNNIKFISFILAGLFLVVIVPILVISAYISSIYTNKFITSLTMGGRIFIRRGIFVFLILLILYCFYFLSLLKINIFIFVLIISLLFILALPIWLLLSYLNAFKIFDDLINIFYYEDKAYLGLYLDEKQKDKINKKKNEFEIKNGK